MVFIRVLVPPLPWRGRREALKSGLVPGLGGTGAGRTIIEAEASEGGVAYGRENESEDLALVGVWRPETSSGGCRDCLAPWRSGR